MSKAAKPKTVGKDFSVLEVKKRIDLTTFEIYRMQFRGEKELAFRPRQGTIVYKIWNSARFTLRQQRAWSKFLKDIDYAQGKSGGVTSSYGEFTDGESDDIKLPTAFTNASYQRIERICTNFLGVREYHLLRDLTRDHMQNTGEAKLEDIGFIRSGYKADRDAHVAGAVNVQCLFDRLADFYGF